MTCVACLAMVSVRVDGWMNGDKSRVGLSGQQA